MAKKNNASKPSNPSKAADPGPPFNSTSRADIILRSSDGVEFYVMKAFLIYASQVFDTMFTLPQSNNSNEKQSTNGLDVVVMAEDSKMLRWMLLFCYPGSHPMPEETEDILNLASIADKYDMDAISKEVQEILVASSTIKEDPLRIFAIAVHHGWESVGRAAARSTLALRLQDLPSSNELAIISGMDLYHLTQYRYQCSSAIRKWISQKGAVFLGRQREGLDTFVWWKVNYLQRNNHCMTQRIFDYKPSGRGEKAITISCEGLTSPWWTEYIKSILKELEFCPFEGTIYDDGGCTSEALTGAASCSFCAASAYKDFPVYKELLAKGIAEVIDEVWVTVTYLLVQHLLISLHRSHSTFSSTARSLPVPLEPTPTVLRDLMVIEARR